METVLFYAGDLADITECPSFDEAAFQTFQIIGQSIVNEFMDRPNPEGLAASFSAALGLFGDAWRLTSGLSMEIIWEQFRLPSVEKPSLLELRYGTQALSESFDALSWTFGASIQELFALRGSLVQVFEMLDLEDAKSGERLKVFFYDIESSALIVTSLGRTTCLKRTRKRQKSDYPNGYQAILQNRV